MRIKQYLQKCLAFLLFNSVLGLIERKEQLTFPEMLNNLVINECVIALELLDHKLLSFGS